MSSPPEYQSLLQRGSSEEERDVKQFPHAYPPAPAPLGENSTPGGAAGPVATVTYTFEPRYPVIGKTEDALGLLYPDREATIQAVQRMFPLLDEFDLDRIDILALHQVDVGPARWGKIMEDAWPHITAAGSAPRQLKVQIKDLPGDERRRRRREALKVCGIVTACVGAPFLFLGTIIGLAVIFGGDN